MWTLDTALAAWRTNRRPELADLIDALAARERPPAIAGKSKAAYQAAWLALAAAPPEGDPLVTAALAAGLTKALPMAEIGYGTPDRERKRWAAFLARIEALAARKTDPQIGRALTAMFEDLPFSVEDGDAVFGPAVALLVRTADVRAVARLQTLLDRPVASTAMARDWLAATLPRAIAKLAAQAGAHRALPAGVAEELAALRATSGTAPPPRAALATLHAEHLADPADAAVRTVYVDALLEAGDPRGEMFTADRKRAAQLLRKHEHAWLGDLVKVTKLRVWRGGYLDEAELLQGASADPTLWQRVIRDPRLATVRTLHKGNASERLYATFVLSPAMRGLREVEVGRPELLRDLCGLEHPIDRVVLTDGFVATSFALLDALAARTQVHALAFATRIAPRQLMAQLDAWPGRAAFDELRAMPHYRVSNEWGTDGIDAWLAAFDRFGATKLGYGALRDHVTIERLGTDKKPRWAIDATLQQAALLHDVAKRLSGTFESVTIRGTPLPLGEPASALKTALVKLRPKVVHRLDGWAET